jgi:hypothetical protein
MGPHDATGGDASPQQLREWWAFTSQYWPLSEEELRIVKQLRSAEESGESGDSVPATKYPVVLMQHWGVPLGSPTTTATSSVPSVLGGDYGVVSLNCRTMCVHQLGSQSVLSLT